MESNPFWIQIVPEANLGLENLLDKGGPRRGRGDRPEYRRSPGQDIESGLESTTGQSWPAGR